MKRTSGMEPAAAAQELGIRAHCRALTLPTVAAHFVSLAEEAVREQKSHRAYLERWKSGNGGDKNGASRKRASRD